MNIDPEMKEKEFTQVVAPCGDIRFFFCYIFIYFESISLDSCDFFVFVKVPRQVFLMGIVCWHLPPLQVWKK
jgi:hypothetical protein